MIELLKNFDKCKYKIGVVTFGKNQNYSKKAKEYSFYFCELGKRPTRLEPLLTIWKCFIDFRPDIVHTWDSLSSMYAWLPCKYYNVKLIDGSIRDSGVDKGFHYYFKRFFLKRASLIISNSNAGLKAYHVRGHVVYNVIDTNRFIQSKENHDFNLVMTANFSEYKDQQTFLNAAIILVKNKVVDNVYLLGEGPHLNKYINWISLEYPEIAHKIHFTGVVDNIEEYISKCHIGVLCSTPRYSEGISNAVLEYMAAGLVPIVTDLGGSAEIVKNGINGYLIQPKDHHKIVELVQQIHQDKELRIKLILSAKKTIEEKFSMQGNSKMLISYYNLLIGSQ